MRILAPTRPFAASYQAANTEIAWGESLSATAYYVGWTLTETVVISDLTSYPTPDYHQQTLPDGGRYYAHVVAVDEAGAQNSYTLGPVYFDGAPPPTYLNWDEDGARKSTLLALARCAARDGPSLQPARRRRSGGDAGNGTTHAAKPKSLYGTWNNEWLALHWDGIDLDSAWRSASLSRHQGRRQPLRLQPLRKHRPGHHAGDDARAPADADQMGSIACWPTLP